MMHHVKQRCENVPDEHSEDDQNRIYAVYLLVKGQKYLVIVKIDQENVIGEETKSDNLFLFFYMS